MKIWIHDVWKRKSCFLPILTHLADQISDIAVAIEFGILATNTAPKDCNGINMWYLFTLTVLSMAIYRTISAYLIYQTSKSLLRIISQLFDLELFRTLYINFILNKSEPCDPQKWITGMEATFESAPQALVQMIFLSKTNSWSKSPIVLVSFIWSVFSIISKGVSNDKRVVVKGKTFSKYERLWYLLRYSWRFCDVSVRILLLGLIWLSIGGTALTVIIVLEILALFILCVRTKNWSLIFAVVSIPNHYRLFIYRLVSNFVILILITCFITIEFTCARCPSFDERQSLLSNGVTLFMFIYSWVAALVICVRFKMIFLKDASASRNIVHMALSKDWIGIKEMHLYSGRPGTWSDQVAAVLPQLYPKPKDHFMGSAEIILTSSKYCTNEQNKRLKWKLRRKMNELNANILGSQFIKIFSADFKIRSLYIVMTPSDKDDEFVRLEYDEEDDDEDHDIVYDEEDDDEYKGNDDRYKTISGTDVFVRMNMIYYTDHTDNARIETLVDSMKKHQVQIRFDIKNFLNSNIESYEEPHTFNIQFNLKKNGKDLHIPINDATHPIQSMGKHFKKRELRIKYTKQMESQYDEEIPNSNFPWVPQDHIVKDVYQFFVLSAELGRGGTCRVLKIRDKQTSKWFAIKEMRRDDRWNAMLFEQECRCLQVLSGHQNILHYEDCWMDNRSFYILTSVCTGGDLFDNLVQLGRFPEEYAADTVRTILDAIGYCHERNIVHRDLNLKKIMYKDRDHEELVIIDFGDAKEVEEHSIHNDFAGSSFYIAPEFIRSREGWELKKSDMWSIGVITYVLVTGMPLFWGKENDDVFKKIVRGNIRFPETIKLSDQCKDFILSLLQKAPEKRLSASVALKHPWITRENTQYTEAVLYNSENVISETFD